MMNFRFFLTIVLPALLIFAVGCSTKIPAEIEVYVPGSNDKYLWTRLDPMPVTRIEMAAVTVGDTLFLFGGFTEDLAALHRSDVFESETGTWRRIADLPENTTHFGAAAAPGGNIWLAGGFVGDNPGVATSHVWRYDIESDAYTPGPDLPEPTGGGMLVAIGEQLHYAGGLYEDRRTDYDRHLVLKPSATEWTDRAPMPSPRNHLSGVSFDGRFYVFGGHFDNDGVHFRGPWHTSPLAHRYDPETDSWEEIAMLPLPLSHATTSTFVHGGRIVVAGGRTVTQGMAACWSYDPASDEWSPLPALPEPLYAGTVAIVGDAVIIAGGRVQRDPPLDRVWSGPLAYQWATN